ncbi:MAG: glutathione S-transferase family protein [Colwellia sp.]|nr:glutathione S-transferase family protein [Colwellia sp.]
MKLIIGNKNYSSWSLRAWLLLRYFDVDFDEQRITLFTPDMHKQMEGFCPNFKVPALIDDHIQVWDSLAICEYINEHYLKGEAWPDDIKQKATARSIVAEMHSGFTHLRNRLPMNCRRKPSSVQLSDDVKNDITRIITIWQQCLNNETRQEGFLFGKFSIADAMYIPVVSRFTTYEIDVPIEVQSYMTMMLNLPAFKEWQQAGIAESEIVVEDEIEV